MPRKDGTSYLLRSAERLGTLSESRHLYRDPITGIAWVEDTSSGMADSLHPNIGPRPTMGGARRLYGPTGRPVRVGQYIYNRAEYIGASEEQNRAALLGACRCGGSHPTT